MFASRQLTLRNNRNPKSRRTRLEVTSLEERAVPTTYTVNTTTDTASGSSTSGALRYCIGQANGGAGADTIVFDASTFPSNSSTTITLDLGLGELSITNPLTITGAGQSHLTISGGSKVRVFNVDMASSGDSVSMTGLTISGGSNSGNYGGGILNIDAVVSLTDCTVTGCLASHGGGIFSYNELDLVRCTISSNIANYGGGIKVFGGSGVLSMDQSTVVSNTGYTNGGGLYIYATTTIANSTISGNGTFGDGGGFDFHYGGSPVIENSTISGNNAAVGGGVCFNGASSSDAPKIYNSTIVLNQAGSSSVTSGGGVFFNGSLKAFLLDSTIVAENTVTGSAKHPDLQGSPDATHSLIGILSQALGGDTMNLTGDATTPLDPGLDALANNGGHTLTHAITDDTSPVYNTGENTLALSFDQRDGIVYERVSGGVTDIGAYELYHQYERPQAVGSTANGEAKPTVLGKRSFVGEMDELSRAARSTPLAYFVGQSNAVNDGESDNNWGVNGYRRRFDAACP